MKTAKRNLLYLEHNRNNKPGLTVEPGEEFAAETELCTGDWLHSVDDTFSREKAVSSNPTVCVEINGAEPGDVLAVKIKTISLDTLGYTGFDKSTNPLANMIYPHDWGLTTKTVEIKNGYINWDDKMKIPVRPMIGTLGTAPKYDAVKNTAAGNHGGNMDVSEVTSGNTVYLPVFVHGALLHIGDVHAVQGDGEINLGGGIECRSEVTLQVDIVKDPSVMEWVRLENDEYIMAVACRRSVEESFYAAAGELLRWMVKDYNFSVEEAYLLMGELLEARCTQFVNPTMSYICKMPKKFLQKNSRK